MSRSVFLSLKDDDFWGNETSEEEESSKESLVEEVKETIAEETEDGEEGWQTTEKTTVPERKKTFQQGDGGFGGFDRNNASAYPQKSPPAVRTKTRQAAGDLPEVEAPVLGFNQTNGVRLSPSTVALNEEVKLGFALMRKLGIEEDRLDCSGHCEALRSCWYEPVNPWPEVYSRKVFVGGIPTTIRQDGQDLMDIFGRFGTVAIDWPCKGETNPKGYVFLIFEEEKSVGKLVSCCENELDRHFLRAPFQGRLIRVQIRPWRLADANYLVHPSIPVDSKRAVFVGGIPRPLRAVELAHMMEQYGPVLVAGIDVDVEYKYPKGAGAGRVVFEHWDSYRRAIADRHTLLSHGDVQKRVEMKPYVLDEMQCEECCQSQALFFCPHEDCLQYYCEGCWTRMHSLRGWDSHKPLVKDV